MKGRCPRPLDDGGRQSQCDQVNSMVKDFIYFVKLLLTTSFFVAVYYYLTIQLLTNFFTGAEVGFEPTALRL